MGKVICDCCKADLGTGEGAFIHSENNKIAILCPQCESQFRCCGTCEHNNCALRTLNVPDIFVNKTVRQGNMVASMPVINPVYVEKYCFACKCFAKAEKICLMQQIGRCKEYKFKFN